VLPCLHSHATKYLQTSEGNIRAFKGVLFYCSEQRSTQLEKWLNENCKILCKPTYDADIGSLKNLEKLTKIRKKGIIRDMEDTVLFD
jgi:hypothetical protein